MNGFKRFCLVVFAVCGTLALAALLLPWVGPWTVEAAGLISLDWYLFLVELFALVCAVYRSLDVRAEAESLQGRLRQGLEVLVGDRLGDITLRFLEPRQTSDITPGRDVHDARGADGAYVPTAVHEADRAARHASGAAPERPQDFGVAVPMKGHGAPVQLSAADDDAPSAVSVRVEPSGSRKGVETDG